MLWSSSASPASSVVRLALAEPPQGTTVTTSRLSASSHGSRSATRNESCAATNSSIAARVPEPAQRSGGEQRGERHSDVADAGETRRLQHYRAGQPRHAAEDDPVPLGELQVRQARVAFNEAWPPAEALDVDAILAAQNTRRAETTMIHHEAGRRLATAEFDFVIEPEPAPLPASAPRSAPSSAPAGKGKAA